MASPSRRETLRRLGVAAVGLAAGCSGSESPATDETPVVTDTTDGTDTGGTVTERSTTDTEDEPPADSASGVEPLWTYDAESVEYSHLVHEDGVVYVPGPDIQALSTDGTHRWTYPTDGPVYRTPIVRDAVYVQTAYEDPELLTQWARALHAVELDGSKRWRFEPEPEQGTGSFELLDIGNGHAYLATRTDYAPADGLTLYAVDTETGNVDWRAEVGSLARGTAVDGGLCVGEYDELRVLETDGSERWSEPFPERPTGALRPVVDRFRAFVSVQDRVHAFDLTTGERLWTYAGEFSVSDLYRAGGSLFVSRFRPNPEPARVAALEPATKHEQWVAGEYDSLVDSELLVDGTLVAAGNGSSESEAVVAGIDVTAGEEAWQRRGVSQPVAALDDAVYACAEEGVVALGPDGSERWQYGTDAPVQSLVAGRDRIFASTEKGRIIAFRA